MIEFKKTLKNKYFDTNKSLLFIDSNNILYEYFIETKEYIKLFENVIDFFIENDDKLIKIIFSNGKIGAILYDDLENNKNKYINDKIKYKNNFGLGINPNFNFNEINMINGAVIKNKYIEAYYGVNKFEENRNISDNISIIYDNENKKLKTILDNKNNISKIFGVNKNRINKDLLSDLDIKLDDIDNPRQYSVDLEIYPFISKNINITANIKEKNSEENNNIITEIN